MCPLGTHSCHDNAACVINVGSYDCVCFAGFAGNGYTCMRMNKNKSDEPYDIKRLLRFQMAAHEYVAYRKMDNSSID